MRGRLRQRNLPIDVLVRRHRHLSLTQMIGDLPRTQACLVQLRGDRAPKCGVTPSIATAAATRRSSRLIPTASRGRPSWFENTKPISLCGHSR